MYSTPLLKNKSIDSFDKITIKRNKPLYSIVSLRKKKDTFKSLFSNKEVLLSLYTRNKFNTYNINKIKNETIQHDLFKARTRNNTIKTLFKCKSENDIEKTNLKDNSNTFNKNKFLLLTSLYKLPVIKSKIILAKKPTTQIFNGFSKNNYITPSNNTSSINSKKSFNDSISSSYNESFNNLFNLRYNNDINKSNGEFNQSNQSKSKRKRKPFSNLYASLKDKYYIDVEKKYNHKLDAKLFPSDHSMKDKIIYMKKVSIFWNSVFKYCVPIINGQKYKLQHMISSENKLKDLNSNLKQSNSNYYDIFVKDNNNSKIKNKSKSQSKLF